MEPSGPEMFHRSVCSDIQVVVVAVFGCSDLCREPLEVRNTEVLNGVSEIELRSSDGRSSCFLNQVLQFLANTCQGRALFVVVGQHLHDEKVYLFRSGDCRVLRNIIVVNHAFWVGEERGISVIDQLVQDDTQSPNISGGKRQCLNLLLEGLWWHINRCASKVAAIWLHRTGEAEVDNSRKAHVVLAIHHDIGRLQVSVDPPGLGLQSLGAGHDVMEKDQDIGIREGGVDFCEVSSAFLATRIHAQWVPLALLDEVMKVPMVHVRHHDPETVGILDVRFRSDR
mmetsp:Transcript_17539/g.41624  ORF Transcript_17539/g.41624 Transcript_17539/m.41624 type:complete len:283 (+) Transcript_17539:430-1278(+)